jgi:hypothetical protein
MRNEKILQLIAYYFSINGDINYLHDELVSMNSIIDQLFTNSVMNNIYLIVYDKNLTPAQMINNFINYDSTKFNEIQNKEEEINNLKDYIEILNKQKQEIHQEFANFCKDKYEVKQKYNNLISEIDKDNIIDDFNLINHNYSSYEKEDLKEEEMLPKINIKIKANEENYWKYKNEEDEINQSKDENDGVKTRKKKKVVFYKDKYYSRKKEKKFVRKNEDKILAKSNKYYIKNK